MLSLLAVVCPPLAVLATGNRSKVAANLGLTLLLYVPGLLHALSEVDRYTTCRKYDAVMRALERTAA
ncbi:MAG TPA: YqaE/Pmp3 family membrane protein [Gemmataceae bacterium]|nr:YqaE/Pmp3 family membrane protein [Gemmataceae bacterium]